MLLWRFINLVRNTKTIKKSKTRDDARANLMSSFSLSEKQAQAILEMQLQRLSGLERQKIEDELAEKLALIADLKDILQKPERVNAIIIEEYGMVGGVAVRLLYLALLYRGMMVFMQSERAYGGLLSAALSFALVMQAFINMGVAVGLGPITGLPLPLVSRGGTSQLFMGISIGIILSVSRGELDEFPSDVKGNGKRRVAAMA